MRLLSESCLWGLVSQDADQVAGFSQEGTRGKGVDDERELVEYQNGHQRTDFEKEKAEMRWTERR